LLKGKDKKFLVEYLVKMVQGFYKVNRIEVTNFLRFSC